MLSHDFYGMYADYTYILLHQLDAWVFKNDFEYWCRQGYDYIGAPWIYKDKITTKLPEFLWRPMQRMAQRYDWHRSKHEPRMLQLYNEVGNGGLSLRKVQSAITVLKNKNNRIEKYIENPHYLYNEDVFWSVEVNRYSQIFKKPHWKEALAFAFELEPSHCFKLKGKLPTACHAFDRYEPEFWQKHIKL
jgi:hypothetical protein